MKRLGLRVEGLGVKGLGFRVYLETPVLSKMVIEGDYGNICWSLSTFPA